MIDFHKNILSNGLRVIVAPNRTTPMVAINVLYDVGSKDEDPEKTGFAHLFEHLMFGGSKNIPDYDAIIQNAGGENNAYTTTDLTSFYNILPAKNIETALWTESDRMYNLNINQKTLDIQKKVVIEEFKETCLEVPYGEVWHDLMALIYKKHPYGWPVIGKSFDHIENATLDDVLDFYEKYYNPSNAVLVIAGNIEPDEALSKAKKWFDGVPNRKKITRDVPLEPRQKEFRQKILHKNIPSKSLYMAFGMVGRLDPDYYAFDILSDVLSNGRSSRLYRKLHKEKPIFNMIEAYISGTFDPGVLVVEGRLMNGISIDQAREEVWGIFEELKSNPIDERELRKIKNKIEASIKYSETNVSHLASSLGYYETLGDAHLINKEQDAYEKVTTDDILRVAQSALVKDQHSELIYLPHDA